jgi:hypothetical protein
MAADRLPPAGFSSLGNQSQNEGSEKTVCNSRKIEECHRTTVREPVSNFWHTA